MAMPFVVRTANGRHRFQRPIPLELRRAFEGKAYWIRTLSPVRDGFGTLDPHEAERLSIPVLAECEAQFEAARRGEWPPVSDERIGEVLQEWRTARAGAGWTARLNTDEESLGQFVTHRGILGFDLMGGNFRKLVAATEHKFPIYEAATRSPLVLSVPEIERSPVNEQNPGINSVLADWLADKVLEPKSKRARGMELAVRLFVECHGDIGMRSITREDAIKFKKHLREMPRRNGGKLTDTTVRSYLGWLNALANWVIDEHGWETLSPFRNMAKKDRQKATANAYLEWTPDQLKILFTSEDFANAPLDPRERNHRFWLPLFAIYQGRRVDEIGTRLISDVREFDGIPYINVAREVDGQSTKSPSSINAYAIHPELIRLGFLEYVAAQKARGESRLFPDVVSTPGNNATNGYSQHFTRYRRKIGLGNKPPSDAKSRERRNFHSFRSNWTQIASIVGMRGEIRYALAGRDIGDTEKDHYGGKRFALTELAQELAKIKYPEIDLSRLYVRETHIGR